MDILKSIYGTTNKEEIEELSLSLEDSDKLTKLITYAPYIYSSMDSKEFKKRSIMVGLDGLESVEPIERSLYLSSMTQRYIRKNIQSIDKKNYLRERLLIAKYGTKKNKEIFTMFEDKFNELSVGVDDLTINEAKERVGDLLVFIYPFIFSYNSVRSISNNNVEVRNIIKRIPKPNITFKGLVLDNLVVGNKRIDTSLDTSIMKKRGEKLNKQIEGDEFHSNAIDIIKEIKRVEEILKNIIVTPKTDYHHINVLEIYLIALSSGRRFTEIVKTAKISPLGYWRGILKKNKEDKGTYKAYLFRYTNEEINERLERLRGRLRVLNKGSVPFDDLTEKQISNRYNGKYNKILREYTSEIKTFHDIRHHWAINGVVEFKTDGESDKETRQRILSHVIPLDASETYSRIFKNN